MYDYMIMKFLILKTTDPYENLAIEEYLFRNCNDDIFMLWQNTPTVVIGKNQNAYAEVNMEYLTKNRINIARRITGGGAVYHDLGNLNFTFVSEKRHNGLDFEYFTSPIILALKSLGIEAELSGRNDILVRGKKISGNAQHFEGNKVLHHGTILFDVNFDELSAALHVDEEKIKSKAIRSVRSRVTNLKPLLKSEVDMNDFIELIADFVKAKYAPEIISPPLYNDIKDLLERNRSPEWLFPNSGLRSDYSIVKKKRYDFGTVEIALNMENCFIRKVKILGDFFGAGDISKLESYLSETDISKISEKIRVINIEQYILGMSNSEFENLILK